MRSIYSGDYGGSRLRYVGLLHGESSTRRLWNAYLLREPLTAGKTGMNAADLIVRHEVNIAEQLEPRNFYTKYNAIRAPLVYYNTA
jgi:hypothetical protein